MLRIRLIGIPVAESDGHVVVGPRGSKAWAVLGRLVRSDDPVSRQVLVSELFADADDPLGALRWTLAELRRSLGAPDAFSGNPVQLGLSDAWIDAREIMSHSAADDLPEGGFLDGVDVRGSPGFDSWLLVERSRIDGEISELLRQETLQTMSHRQFDQAAILARALVARNPLSEGPHVLLVKALASGGHEDAARRQVEASEALFLEELGTPASPAIRSAARRNLAVPVPGVSARSTAISLCDAGKAAVSAGAADAGIECLRSASATAEASGDSALHAQCLTELGIALVHSVRGYDDEGAIVLRTAAELARGAGADLIAATALSELSYVDLLAGRRTSAIVNLRKAGELAVTDPEVAATVAGFEALNLNDSGHLAQASVRFAEAIELARAAGAVRQELWLLGIGARTLYLLDRYDEAADWAKRSCDLAVSAQWSAFRPWPESWLAHARLARGEDPARVRDAAVATFAVACQMGDPCWEGIAAKSVGLTYLAEDDPQSALEWLTTASDRSRRETDSYMWVSVDILLAESQAALAAGESDRAESVARRAIAEAAATGMDDLLARGMRALERVRQGFSLDLPG